MAWDRVDECTMLANLNSVNCKHGRAVTVVMVLCDEDDVDDTCAGYDEMYRQIL